MEGKIREYSHRTRQGIIDGVDGAAYAFTESQWEAHGMPIRGVSVQFDESGGTATNIQLATRSTWSRSSARSGGRSRVIAAVLAVFAGCLGAHKFYLGKGGVAAVHILLTAGGIFLWVVPNIVLADSPAEALLICALGWVGVFGIYYAIRKYRLGHTTQEILRPLRPLRWPFLIFRLPRHLLQRASGSGTQSAGQQQNSQSAQPSTSNDSVAASLIFHTLGVALYVSFAVAIAFLFYVLAMMLGFFLIGASIAIGLAEGFQYLRKSDAEFAEAYLEQDRSWF